MVIHNNSYYILDSKYGALKGLSTDDLKRQKTHILPAFDIAKKDGVRLLLPKEWHKVFSDVAQEGKSNVNEIINYPLEMGIIVNSALEHFKDGVENNPGDTRYGLAGAIASTMEILTRAKIVPGQMHIKGYGLDIFNSILEKFGAIKIITTKKPGTTYKTYRIPIDAKKYCQSLADLQGITLTHVILDLIMTGIATIEHIKILRAKGDLDILEENIVRLGEHRIMLLEYSKEKTQLRIAPFIKKKDTTPEQLLEETLKIETK